MLTDFATDWGSYCRSFPSNAFLHEYTILQDPAIQQAQRLASGAVVSLEDYNPFEEQAKPQLQINSTNTAAVVQPLSQNVPPPQTSSLGASAPSTSIQITSEELQVTTKPGKPKENRGKPAEIQGSSHYPQLACTVNHHCS